MSIYDEDKLCKIFYNYFREIPDEYNLSFFLRFFPKSYYGAVLKPQHKKNIESCVLQGIENGKLNYLTGKVSGTYSYAATWAVDCIDQFDSKEQIIEAVRQHALKSSLSQNYAIWYFHEYIVFDRVENISYYKNIFFKRKKLRKIDYQLLRLFISSKKSLLYNDFCNLIDKYERTRNLTKEERLPDELSNDIVF